MSAAMTPASAPSSSGPVSVGRALLSTYDKTGLVDFARRLAGLGISLMATGGTKRILEEAGLSVTSVEAVTGAPELLGGRVKTLHPAIHAALLARRDEPEDMRELEAHDITPIDLVVSNLYPFSEAVASEGAHATVLEHIDIGGPTMLRAAAKNHPSVAVVSDPADYEAVARELEQSDGQLAADTRADLARRAFAHTATYEQAIAHYMAESGADAGDEEAALPDSLQLSLPKDRPLRYGENPHQAAALYGASDAFYEHIHGKALSFNNVMDLSAALQLIDEFRDHPPTCAILKHTNPSGVAVADTLETAYQRAFATDRQSPFGGIVVVNRTLDRPTAEAIDAIFTEMIIAPDFAPGVVDLLKAHERRRLIRHRAPARRDTPTELRSVVGGVLAQQRDPVHGAPGSLPDRWTVATDRAPTDAEQADLDFAWRVVKHVKSNAIVYARDQATLGIGAGQMSRIDSAELAAMKGAKSELDFTDAVVASDAFFPFADGLNAAADQDIRAAIQPGGSIRDDEVIEAANDQDLAMVLTGHRHFRH